MVTILTVSIGSHDNPAKMGNRFFPLINDDRDRITGWDFTCIVSQRKIRLQHCEAFAKYVNRIC